MGQRAHDVLPQFVGDKKENGKRSEENPIDELEAAHFDAVVDARSVHQESGKTDLEDDGAVQEPVIHSLQKSSMTGFN